MKYKIISIVFFSLLFSSARLFAQAEHYPYYLEYYWSGRDRNFAVKVTNKLINSTEKGEEYITEYNDAAHEYDELQSASLFDEYERLAGKVKAKEKQYNTAKTMAALAQTSYNLCRSNCQSKYQTYVNATNNVNRIVQEYRDLVARLKSMQRSVQQLQDKLDTKRDTVNRLGEKIEAYIRSQRI
jgi:cell fate (sporulation/competence/biofilm development) regulator YlbF (YheA/YmcA/DUF963 family)